MPKKISIHTSQPLISVIMPVHNAEKFIIPALESLLQQTYAHWELLCVNDASTDATAKILMSYVKRDPRIHVYHNKVKSGIGHSLNKALKHTKGAFIARMDGDDVSLPQRLERQMKFLQRNPSIVACGGQVQMIDVNGRIFAFKKFPTDSQFLYKMIMRMVPIQHPAIMVRGDILRAYSYREDVPTAEDVDMLFYLLSKGAISNIRHFIYQYRKSDASNGYHDIKRTFYITFGSRIEAIVKYGYRPSLHGLLESFLQYAIVSILPNKTVMQLFERIRFEAPMDKKTMVKLFFRSLLPQKVAVAA